VFGNPVAFTIAELLLANGAMSPSEIARAVGRSLSRVSHTLAALRLADVVRYDSDKKLRARYRLKHPREIRQVVTALSKFVDSVSASK
jgi:predicted transcriptional regulator